MYNHHLNDSTDARCNYSPRAPPPPPFLIYLTRTKQLPKVRVVESTISMCCLLNNAMNNYSHLVCYEVIFPWLLLRSWNMFHIWLWLVTTVLRLTITWKHSHGRLTRQKALHYAMLIQMYRQTTVNWYLGSPLAVNELKCIKMISLMSICIDHTTLSIKPNASTKTNEKLWSVLP